MMRTALYRNHPALLPASVVVLATVLVFGGSMQADFLTWGDGPLLTANPYMPPRNADAVRHLITTPVGGFAIPLSMLSYALVTAVAGASALPHHLTNLLLHAITTGLLFAVVLRLLRGAPGRGGAMADATADLPPLAGATAAAALFGWHPLRAESVAWAAGRGELLAGAFLLGGVLLYLRRGRAARWPLLLSLIGAMASHPAAAASPLLLVLLPPTDPDARGFSRRERRLFVLFGVAATIAVLVLSGSGTTVSGSMTLSERLAIGFHRLPFSLWKTLAPTPLAPVYSLPSSSTLLAGGFTVLLITVLAVWRHGKGAPAVLAGWGATLALMLPLVLLIPGQQPLADRYSYLAGAPLAALAGAGVSLLLTRTSPRRRTSLAVILALPLAALAVLAFRQTALWRSPESLWRHAVTTSPGVSLAHYHLGLALTGAGKRAEALAAFQQAITLSPAYVDAHIGAAQQFYEQDNLERAHFHATKALQLDTTSAPGWNIRGMALYRGGRKEEARKSFRAAQIVRPDDPLAYVNMALIDLTDRNAAGATELLHRALELGADSLVVIPYLATARVLARDGPGARVLLTRLTVGAPGGPSVNTRLADIHLRLRDTTAALDVLDGAATQGDTSAAALLRRIRRAPLPSDR